MNRTTIFTRRSCAFPGGFSASGYFTPSSAANTGNKAARQWSLFSHYYSYLSGQQKQKLLPPRGQTHIYSSFRLSNQKIRWQFSSVNNSANYNSTLLFRGQLYNRQNYFSCNLNSNARRSASSTSQQKNKEEQQQQQKQQAIQITNHDTIPEIDSRTLYKLLDLSKFTKSEMDWRFDHIVKAGDRIDPSLLTSIDLPTPPSSNNLEPPIIEAKTMLDPYKQKTNQLQQSPIQENIDYDAETDQLQQQRVMHIHDLEAFLFEEYVRKENEWIEKNHVQSAQHLVTISGVNDDESHQLKGQQQFYNDNDDADAVTKRSQIIEIEKYAKIDAASIFRLLIRNAPLEKTDHHAQIHNASSSGMSSISTSASSANLSQYNNNQPPTTLTKTQFHQSLTTISSQIHYHTILPLAASMLLVGSSVGVISPVMPFVAEKLNLSSTHYGVVVSSFALMKMMGNVPSAILVERHGRKPYLVHSLLLVGMGVAGMGIAQDWIQLSLCRMTIGLGVAALTTASTLTVADVSTPLSRASTFSPVMSAFAAGTALGPALGGILCDEWGIRNTFLVVGLSYGVLAVWNHLSLVETKRDEEWWEKERLPWHKTSTGKTDTASADNTFSDSMATNLTATISNAIRDTTEQWSTLLADPRVRPVVIMNGFYMCAISGTQMTLLPLLLTGGGAATSSASGMALTATAVGQVYMWMSAVQVLGNPAAGRFADRAGKGAAIILGGTLTSLAMASVPLVCAYGFLGDGGTSILDASNVNWPVLASSLGVWALGGTLLATSHVAAISDAVHDSRRSQAIALLRTAGDVGFLCGAAGAGLAADVVGDVGLAMQAGSGVLMGATVWFGLQTLALKELEKNRRQQRQIKDDDRKS